MRIAAVLAIALLLTGAVFVTTDVTTNNRGLDFDGVFYAAMAHHPEIAPDLAHVVPWCYRVLTPAVVSVMPWETLTSFRVAAFVSDVASLALLFLILRGLGFSGELAGIGMMLYGGVFWTLKFSFYAPAYIDPETQVVLLAIIYLVIARRYAALTPALIVAALQKESLAALSLFCVAALVRDRGDRTWPSVMLYAAAMVAAPLAAILVTQALVVAGPDDSYSSVREVVRQIRLMRFLEFWSVLAQSTFSGLGILLLVAVLRPRSWVRFFRDRYEWIVYAATGIALLFAGRDKARLFLYLLPAAILCSTMVVRDAMETIGRRRALAWAAVMLALHFYAGGYLTPIRSFDDYLARMVPEHSKGLYRMYLVRNAVLAGGFLIFSMAWLGRKGHNTKR